MPLLFALVAAVALLIIGGMALVERRAIRRLKGARAARRSRHRATRWMWDWMHVRTGQKRLTYIPNEDERA